MRGVFVLDRLENDVFDFAQALLCFADETDVVAANLVLLCEFDLDDGRECQREDAFHAHAV